RRARRERRARRAVRRRADAAVRERGDAQGVADHSQGLLPESREGESMRGTVIAVTAIFVVLALLLGTLAFFYWNAVLHPRLRTEGVSQAEILASSQANFIADALRSGDGQDRRRRVIAALDELLLLRDAKS